MLRMIFVLSEFDLEIVERFEFGKSENLLTAPLQPGGLIVIVEVEGGGSGGEDEKGEE